jgi:hypothetical protein
MRRVILGIASISALLACGGSSKPPLFTKPAGTVAVSFSVDDSANKVWKDGEMIWKGSMIYDSKTNKVVKDPNWGGPWAALYDDGPLSQGGHEAEGSKAGDHIFGTVVFVTPPALTASDAYEYGLCDGKFTTDACANTGWVWAGSVNGSFTVAAGATADQKADGMTFKAFGTTDVQLTIDKNNLATSGGPWDTSKITVKGGAWGWNEVQLTDNGSGKFIFTLSNNVGAGKTYYHTGLLTTGDKPEFIFVFNGKEYKDTSSNANTTGVTAGAKAATASTFSSVAVQVQTTGFHNTYITVP